jgi:hypothetical protein
MDIGADIFRTRGRAARPVIATLGRELVAADLLHLGAEKGSKAPALKRLSERHHALARTLASGVAPGEAAIICRYDPSRVSILLDDPAFQELLAFYRADVNAKYMGLHEQLGELAIDAAEILGERLRDTPDDISVGQLQDIIKLGADRTGHGPQATQTNLNINVDLASRLEAARRRVRERTLTETENGC